ncbi:alpha/beta fold hydrolase [Embleya sp. NBC_00896]|uniref:alpha/beta fold hydrolase n=1 Tax=Embleya sp. NBC_00896 TaxID=2975961 RepID=UPI00386682BD|nr:alpha/beta hydrolase [Embleya sp. NBC_00896]
MANVGVNGVSLYCEIQGTGPSVVLVHGSWGDADGWARVAPGLAERCTVVSYDRRGHSRSEDPPSQGSVHEDVADLAGLIEVLDLGPAFVCGNSYGSLITLRLAASRPELLRGIAVHEPPGIELLRDDPDLRPIVEGITMGQGPVRALLEAGESAAAAELFVDTIAFGPGAWAQFPAPLRHTFITNAPTYLDELRDPDAFDLDLVALRRFTDPVLLTHSDDTAPMFALALERIGRSLPQAEHHLYASAGHMPHVSQAEEYIRVTLPRALE